MNKKNKIMLWLIVYSLIVLQATFAAGNYTYSQNNYSQGQNLQGYALYVPAGITCSVLLSQEINSESAVIGQPVNAVLTEDFIYNGQTIASSGSVVTGSIVDIKKAGYGNRNAKMQIRFSTIRTPYDNIIPISAIIATNDSTGILKGGLAKDSAKDYAKNTVVGAGSGAVLGTAMGALSGGSVGRGAVYGTAVGAGLGLIKGAANKGDSILIPANSRIDLYFDQPITLGAQ